MIDFLVTEKALEILIKSIFFIIIWLIAIKILYGADKNNGGVIFVIGLISSVLSIIILRSSGFSLIFLFSLIGAISSFAFPVFLGQGFGFQNNVPIKIILVGSQERIGTTTMALNIGSYLESIGAKTSYTEGNTNGHLNKIHKLLFKDSLIIKNCFKAKEIDCFFKSIIPSRDYDFNIIDLGVLTDTSIKIFNSMEGIKILCGGVKPYEIPKLVDSVNQLKNSEDYYVLLPGQNSIKIEDYMSDYKNYTIYNINYTAKLFDANTNKSVWETLLSQHISENYLEQYN